MRNLRRRRILVGVRYGISLVRTLTLIVRVVITRVIVVAAMSRRRRWWNSRNLIFQTCPGLLRVSVTRLRRRPRLAVPDGSKRSSSLLMLWQGMPSLVPQPVDRIPIGLRRHLRNCLLVFVIGLANGNTAPTRLRLGRQLRQTRFDDARRTRVG